MAEHAVSLLKAARREILALEMDEGSGRLTAMARISALNQAYQGDMYLVGEDDSLLVAPDRAVQDEPAGAITDAEGNHPLAALLAMAGKERNNGPAYHVFPRQGGFQLGVALYFAPWRMTVCATVPLQLPETSLDERRLAALDELRARLGEIVIGQSGYLFVFDESCTMIAHPTMAGEPFETLTAPGASAPLCEEVKQAAERPWGKNKLDYAWDRPDDQGNFDYPKITWVVREPTTGWYVAASAYREELESALPQYIKGMFMPALGSILLLGGALALLLRNLLRPVAYLIDVCQEVSRGNLSVSAREDVPGELGFLGRHFNFMIRRLQGLRRKEERRRQELEELNLNLEKIVTVRTRALEKKARQQCCPAKGC
jgi:HAMP domain-containing protein